MLSEIESHPLVLEAQAKGEQVISLETGTFYQSLDEIVIDAQKLGCDAIVNCTGLGSTGLCKDEHDLESGRGILLHYDRWNCVKRTANSETTTNPTQDVTILTEDEPWGSATEACYIIPRGDVLVVGGSYQTGDRTPELRVEERQRLERNAWILGIDTRKSTPVSEWAGFRPSRSCGVRLELDDGLRCNVNSPISKLVHCYGHGGSGWTVSVGAANEVMSLLGL